MRVIKKRGRKASKSSLTSGGKSLSNEEIVNKINEYKEHEFKKNYGYHLITRELKREFKLLINHKKVYRLMKESKILKDKKRAKLLTKSGRCKNRIVTASNQVWESDIKYLPVAGERKTLYKISIIDVFDRDIVAYSIVESCTAKVARELLLKALYERGLKGHAQRLIMRTDNGSQYVSNEFIGLCLDEGIIPERIPPASPNYNAHIESYHRYLDENCLNGQIYMTKEELIGKIGRYVKFYKEERPHSSLEWNTPQSVYESNGKILKKEMIVTL